MQKVESWRGVLISLFRIVVGLLFACHGAATLFGVLGGAYGTGQTAPVGSWPAWWAALIELVTGGLVLIGLFTRPAAVLASGTMAYAYFTVHQPDALMPIQNHGEPAVLFCWSFLMLAVVGPGSLALDTVLTKATRPGSRTSAAPVPEAAG